MLMEWAKLAAQVLQTLVWPVTLLFVVLKFRRQISERLRAVTKAEFPGGLKFELGELKQSVEQSTELTSRTVPAPLPSPADDLARIGDPHLAVASIRLEIERVLVRLAQLSLGLEEARKLGTLPLLSRLREQGVVPKETEDRLLDYVRVTNQVYDAPDVSAIDLVRSLSVGASLLSHIRYLLAVEWLVRDFDGHLLWQRHAHEGSNHEYYLWSAIAATLPEFDYSYEAFCEAATRFNRQEAGRAEASSRDARQIHVLALAEFVEILEFRRRELQRILHGKWWDSTEWTTLREWQWPEEWGQIGWTGPVVRESRNEAEIELLRTDAAIERYSRQISRSSKETLAN